MRRTPYQVSASHYQLIQAIAYLIRMAIVLILYHPCGCLQYYPEIRGTSPLVTLKHLLFYNRLDMIYTVQMPLSQDR